MAVRDTQRRDAGPNRKQLRRDKDVVVRRRTTEQPEPFVPKLAVKDGVSVIELLQGAEGVSLEEEPR